MDEETGSQKRGAWVLMKVAPERGGPDITMGTGQVSSESWLTCPYLFKFTNTGGAPLCSSVRSEPSCPISRVCGVRGQRQAHVPSGELCEIQPTMSCSSSLAALQSFLGPSRASLFGLNILQFVNSFLFRGSYRMSAN